ncbi:diaminopimelate epimerase [Bacteroidia bacterium]|nr:diaminopimelate epimerase [Bacteroidia bacterium]
MHGAGNDYVYVNGFTERVDDPAAVSIRVSDRHKGIGADGLVLILPSETCDFRMRMFNADGSEAQMCGNATRCIAKYVYDRGLTDKTTVTLETKGGVKTLKLYPVNGKVERVTVDMGEPITEAKKVPVKWSDDRLIDQTVDFQPEKYAITAVSMGNPHAVIFTQGISTMDIETIGRKIETHPMFPEKTNTEFVEILSRTHAKMRVWERGSGETQACGTGACATLVAAVLTNRLDRKATISLPGGDLELEWNAESNRVFMTGPAVEVFTGEF